MHNPTHVLKSVKGLGNTFDLNPKWERTLPSFDNFSWDIYSPPPPKSKYQSWYLTSCCGLEVQNPTKALKSFKDSDNTFDINPSVKELCRPSTIFQGIFIGSPTKSKYQRWYLTPCCGLEVHNNTQALKSVKGPSNNFDLSGKELCRTSTNFHGMFINPSPPHHQIEILKLIFNTLLWAWGAKSQPGT